MKYYIQCLLTKRIPSEIFPGNFDSLKLVSWIPIEFAKSGKILKLQRDDDTWSDGWIVQEAYSMHDENFVITHERDWAKQRKASDI